MEAKTTLKCPTCGSEKFFKDGIREQLTGEKNRDMFVVYVASDIHHQLT